MKKEERLFLQSQKVPASMWFDAKGKPVGQCEDNMKAVGAIVAYNTTSCEFGHTVRTKAGHCAQCDTSRIARQRRSRENAQVYIAGSYKMKLIKVGSSIDIDDRLTKLNAYRYGGAQDWKMLVSVFVSNAGKIENYLQSEKLKNFRVKGEYVQNGIAHSCYELFRCDFEDAYKPLKAISNQEVRIRCSSLQQAIKTYKFS